MDATGSVEIGKCNAGSQCNADKCTRMCRKDREEESYCLYRKEVTLSDNHQQHIVTDKGTGS
jgi:hypothetical protein